MPHPLPRSDGLGMKTTRLLTPSTLGLSAFSGYRFPLEVILLAVRWYLRYGLSYRDLEELLAERGIEVDHVTLFRWIQHFDGLHRNSLINCTEIPYLLRVVKVAGFRLSCV